MPRELPPILCVCTGNICRSPMAAALLNHALAAEASPLNRIPVRSAGVAAMEGELVTSYSVKALAKVGLDIAGQRSQGLSGEMLRGALLVLVMTEAHRQAIRRQYPENQTPVHLFREFMGGGQPTQISDPWGLEYRDYEATRDAMVEAMPSLLAWLRRQVPGWLTARGLA